MKFRKKPVVVDAIQWIGSNIVEMNEFITVHYGLRPTSDTLEIPTPEGIMEAKKGDFIIKGVNGEFYPCKPDIFEKTYEAVAE